MGSSGSMVSKAQLELKGPPDYWVTPKWVFHINAGGDLDQGGERNSAQSTRKKFFRGQNWGGGPAMKRRKKNFPPST